LGKSLSFFLCGVINLVKDEKEGKTTRERERYKKVPLGKINFPQTLNRWETLFLGRRGKIFFVLRVGQKNATGTRRRRRRRRRTNALKTGDNNTNRRRRRKRKRRRWQTPPARVKEKRTIAEAPRRCVEGILFFFSHSSFALNVCPPSSLIVFF
tara:strand:+ start:593 stop:1054 length:462 start_codon:yes stop_codon:yes gene_type:complete